MYCSCSVGRLAATDALVGAQRDQRVDWSRGGPGSMLRPRRRREEHGDADERSWVERRQAEEHAADRARRCRSAGQTEADADRRQRQALSENQAEHVPPLCASAIRIPISVNRRFTPYDVMP